MNRQEYLAKYREDHREELRQKAKEYDTINKAKKKEYYLTNKDKIIEKNHEKITCVCDVEITRNSLSKHLKTEKHLKRIVNC